MSVYVGLLLAGVYVYNCLILFICFITVFSLPSTFPRYKFWIQCVLLRMLFAWIWFVTSVLMIMTFQASLAVPQGLRDDLGRLSTSWAAPNLCPDCGESMIFFSKEQIVHGKKPKNSLHIFHVCVGMCVCLCLFKKYVYIYNIHRILYVSNID